MHSFAKITIFSSIFCYILLQTLVVTIQSQEIDQYHGAMQIKSTIIGKDRFSFVAKVAEGKTQPDSCRVCLIKPPNNSNLCCDNKQSNANADNCNGKSFENLQAGMEYQLNMCYGNTNKNILTYEFSTKNIPKIKKVTYNSDTRIMAYDVKYKRDQDIPALCQLKYANNTVVGCIEREGCGCHSGSVRIQPNQENNEYLLLDPFGGWLFVFKPSGPSPKDPAAYTFQISQSGISFVPYQMASVFGDLTDGKFCSIINIEDNSKLNCRVGGKITNDCICTTGVLVNLKPSKSYNVRIEFENEIILDNLIFRTARAGQEIDHIIGMKKYKYTVKYGNSNDLSVGECKVCVIRKTTNKYCCFKEQSYISGDFCNTREFSKEEIEKVGGRDFTINICNNYEDRVISDSFSMPKPIENTEFTPTSSSIQYKLNFQDNHAPTYCKFFMKYNINDAPTETKCLSGVDCPCSHGSISYPARYGPDTFVVITDYFGTEIKRVTVDLSKKDEETAIPDTGSPNPNDGTNATGGKLPTDGTSSGGGSPTDSTDGTSSVGGSPTDSTVGTSSGAGGPTDSTDGNKLDPSTESPTSGKTSTTTTNTSTGIGTNNTPTSVDKSTTVGKSDSITPTTDGSTTDSSGKSKTDERTPTTPTDTSTGDVANTKPNTGSTPSPTAGTTTTKPGESTGKTNTEANDVDGRDDEDKGELGNQGLSGGAIAGIVVFVLILVGSVGGVTYYMTQIKGKK